MEEMDVPGSAPELDEEAQLRKRLFELETAMARIRDLDPADAELGYQRNEEPFSKVQHEGRFIPSPSESGGAGF